MSRLIVFILAFLIPALSEAKGPLFRQKDPIAQQEFDNVYQDISNVLSGTISTLNVSSMTVSSMTISSLYTGITLGKLKQTTGATTSTSFATTSSAFQSTNLSATITPGSTASRIKITVTGVLISNADNVVAYATLARDTDDLSPGNGFGQCRNNVGHAECPVAMIYIDPPATTSPVTYRVRLKNSDGSGSVIFGDSNSLQIMVLEEILL